MRNVRVLLGKNGAIPICPKCGLARYHDKWLKLDSVLKNELNERIRKKTIAVINEICPNCAP